MKALTGLPTSTYLKVAEEAKLQLSDLLKLVAALEAGLSPPYIARYRTDLSAGLDGEQLHELQRRLRYFVELEDRRITILSAIGQQNRLTPELRKRIEGAVERHELDDLYLPFRQKRRTPADEALEKGLEPLARFLWDQQPPTADIEGVAQGYVDASKGIEDVPAALLGARHIVARWLAEVAEFRGVLRQMALTESRLVVAKGPRWKADTGLRKKFDWLANYSSPAAKAGWRQALALRRAVRDGALEFEIVLPDSQAVSHLLNHLLSDRKSLFCLQLGAAARDAFQQYLAPALRSDVLQTLNDRADREAAAVFKKNLKKTLMSPAAGPLPVIGLETSRPGGWRAAVVAADGSFLEGAVVRGGEQPASAPPASGKLNTSQNGSKESIGAALPGPDDKPDEAAASNDGVPAAAEGVSGASMNGGAKSDGGNSTEEEVTGQSPAEEPPVADQESESAAAEEAADAKTADARSDSPEATVVEESSEAAKSPEPPADAASPSPSDGSPVQPGSGEKQPRANIKEPATPAGSMSELIRKHNAGAVVISNGPGLRQTERFVRSAIRDAGAPKVFWSTVNEAGSWIYATSKSSRREDAGTEAAIRSAISLARRLQDPLREMIKVDPRLLGIGQYNAEVDPAKLRTQLRLAVQACVHRVGADLNTAPVDLLACVSGITTRVAKRIVEFRAKNGKFTSREKLKDVPGISERLYQQAAGFLRVCGGENPLDATGIHPESYPAVEKILAAADVSAQEALENPESLDSINIVELEAGDYEPERLRALVDEFRKQARSPRQPFKPPSPPVDLLAAEDLKAGITIEGVVANVTEFGAFVDIGADQDGLIHNSHLSEQFFKNGKAAVKGGDRISVRILAIDKEAQRISLTTKDPAELARAKRAATHRPAGPRSSEGRRSGGPRRRKGPQREVAVTKRSFGPDTKQKAREAAKVKNLSMDQKLSLLESKFRTKI